MLYIDTLSYNNKLKNISIMEKVLLTGGALLLAVASSSVITPMLIFVLMHSVMFYAGIPVRYVTKMWMLPLPFIGTSLLTSIVSISPESLQFAASIQLGIYYVGITEGGIQMAKIVGCRSVAAISCMYALATTTPIAYLTNYLVKIPSLKAVGEIALLAYHFIFVVLETAESIYIAQQSRLGYRSWKSSFHAITMLAANLGTRTFLTSRNLYIALQSRNYNEQLVFRTYQSPIVFYRMAIIIVGLVLLYFTMNL